MKAAIPLVLFLGLVATLAAGLRRDPRLVASPLIGKPAPMFTAVQLANSSRTFAPEDMMGRVWLLNVWASWCVACRAEHGTLLELRRLDEAPVVGLNYKDNRSDALRWIEEAGNPYILSAQDSTGAVGIDYGVYGVPETYLIDKSGVIRFKQVGPLTLETLRDTVLPMIRDLAR
jgi:cytochrome c biogenesis protein CcmG/thiol:disulfide interchange protein DsbE